jgi:hypothetical protein
VAARHQIGFGNPNAVFITAHLNLRDGHNHRATRLDRRDACVKSLA